MESKKKLGNIGANVFRGGCNTVHERSLIPSGGYSMIQNMRNKHPGLKKREGHIKHHLTADSTNQVVTLYQFSKGKSASAERHFFAQMGDNDILEATNAPPYNLVATAAFGDEVFSSSGTMLPISWSHVDDILIMSDGVDQHKVYAGTANYVKKFIYFDGAAAPPSIPDLGLDYTQEVTDGDSTTSASITLNTNAAFERFYICTPIRCNRLTWDIGSVNNNASAATLKYWKSDGTWATTSMTDGTASPAGTPFAQDGSMTWTFPSDELPRYMFGVSGYWYEYSVATLLDVITIIGLTYGSDGVATGTRTSFIDIENVWNGLTEYATEARHHDASASIYYTYATDSVEIDSMTSSDKVYFNYPDQIEGVYIDVGNTPNTVATTTINSVYCWNGTAFAALTILQDETNGLANSGWVTWKRPSVEHPTQFQNAKYDSFWYYFTVDKTISDDVIISIEVMPYFNVNDLGKSRCNTAWKDRACYSFDRYPQYLYISEKNNILALNGGDFGILQAGDGRANDIVCMLPFYNELLVWQEEKGYEGGCLTLFQGKDPATWGKLILSTRIGSFNAKSAITVDGVLTSTSTDEVLKTLAFFLSHYGVCCTDGKTVTIISDEIQNYFDPQSPSTCIRRGYENENWLGYDSCYNILRAGLVTGTTATKPNTFLVFDLTDKTWSFDLLAQELSCITEVEAASGNIPILQYGGGTDDGIVYRLNASSATYTGHAAICDVATAIDAYATIEINSMQMWLQLRKLLLTVKSQTAGNVIITPYKNGVAGTAMTLSMIVEQTSEEFRRHIIGLDIQNSQISLKFQNATSAQDLYLLKLGLDLWIKPNH
jgi:hypothetical protein